MAGSKRLRGCHTGTNRISEYNVCVEGTVDLYTILQGSGAESAHRFLPRSLAKVARSLQSESDDRDMDAMAARVIHGDTGGHSQGRHV